MSDREKYEALMCILISGENPRLFEFSPTDFLEELWFGYLKSKDNEE